MTKSPVPSQERPRARKPALPKALVRSEHDEQKDLFAWAELESRRRPALHLLFAIPNFAGRLGKATAIHGAKLKAEGRKPGVPDVMLPVGGGYGSHGLFIEMKRANGVPSDVNADQKAWHHWLRQEGYSVAVCYGFEEAREAILTYLQGNP